MPEKATIERARRDARAGKSASTQAGEFVREQIHHIREGKHGARSTKQAIAIGLSEARRSGVKLPPPQKGQTSAIARRKAQTDSEANRSGIRAPRRTPSSRKRAAATLRTLRKEPRRAASTRALSHQARQAARRRGPDARSRAAQKAAQTRRRRAL